MEPPRRHSWGPLTFTLLVAVLMALLLARALAALAPAGTPTTDGGPAAAPATKSVAAVPAPLPDQLHSQWVSQSPPVVIWVGATTTVTMRYRNTGSVAWVRGAPSEVRLGIPDGSERWAGMAVRWPLATRPAVQLEDVVAPGQIATFRFSVRGTLAGVHRIYVRPVVDGVAWLEDEGAHAHVEVIEDPRRTGGR